MSDQWYIKTKSGSRGPYSTDQLQRYVDAGAIRPNSGIGDEQGNWFAASSIDGLVFTEDALNQAAARSGIGLPSGVSSGQGSTATEGLEAQRQAAHQELETLRGELAGRESELSQREEQVANQEDALRDRGERLETLALELDSRSKEIEQQRQEIEQSRQECDRQREEIERQRAELDQQRGELEVQQTGNETDIQSLKSQIEQIQLSLETERADWQEKLSGLEKSHEEAEQSYRNEHEGLRQQITELEQSKSELEQQTSELANRESEWEATRDQFETRQAALNESETTIAEREATIATRLAELDQREDQLRDREQSLTQQEQGVEDREQVVAKREAEIEQQCDQLAEREEQLGHASQEHQSRQSEYDALRGEYDELRGKHDELRATVESTDSANAEFESTIAELRQNVTRLESDLEAANSRMEETGAELVRLQEAQSVQGAVIEAEDSEEQIRDLPADELLSQKRELLREFAARQESLAQREAELNRRETELTRRELDIATLSPSSEATDSGESQGSRFDQNEDAKVIRGGTELPMDDSATTLDEEQAGSELQANSWEEVFDSANQAQRGPFSESDVALDSVETLTDDETLFVDHDPRYSPIRESTEEVSEDAAEGTFAVSGHESESQLAEFDVSSENDQCNSSSPRLPSEMLPSELSEYDGLASEQVSAVVTSERTLIDVRQHVFQERFGPCGDYHVDEDTSMRVDVSVHPPSSDRDFTTLVTSGMSDYPIAMPNGQRSVRAELILYVTHIDETAINLVRGAAKIPYRRKHGLSIGTTASLSDLSDLLSGSNQQDCVYMLPVVESDSKPIAAQQYVGSAIQLFWLVTITEAERLLIEESGIHKFLSLLEKNNHAVYFDLMRDCYVKRKGWFRR